MHWPLQHAQHLLHEPAASSLAVPAMVVTFGTPQGIGEQEPHVPVALKADHHTVMDLCCSHDADTDGYSEVAGTQEECISLSDESGMSFLCQGAGMHLVMAGGAGTLPYLKVQSATSLNAQ